MTNIDDRQLNQISAALMRRATITKTKEAQAMGPYDRTEIDDRKDAADFLIVQVGPTMIRWRDGRLERVTDRQLSRLQAAHTWAPDF